MQQITGIIITLNEANNIESCIESLRQVCSEIIVVDSNSQDQTVALAEAAGARVFRQPYLGDGPQKNFGLQFASHDWVLSLDADERLTPELVVSVYQPLMEAQSGRPLAELPWRSRLKDDQAMAYIQPQAVIETFDRLVQARFPAE